MKRKKPREFWIVANLDCGSHATIFESKQLAKSWANLDEEIIHVQEVLPKRRKRRAKS